jgi:hypothetical protein
MRGTAPSGAAFPAATKCLLQCPASFWMTCLIPAGRTEQWRLTNSIRKKGLVAQPLESSARETWRPDGNGRQGYA